MTRPNYERLDGWLYIVRTQAGFRQAVKDYDYSGYEVIGFPRSYPCLVFFSTGYQGYHYIQAHAVPLNSLTQKIAEHELKYGQDFQQVTTDAKV